jgi:hypothetical protein
VRAIGKIDITRCQRRVEQRKQHASQLCMPHQQLKALTGEPADSPDISNFPRDKCVEMSRPLLRMVVMGVIATAALSVVALVALFAVLSPQQVAHRWATARAQQLVRRRHAKQ